MSRDKLLPREQLVSVVTTLYADAEELAWETLPLADRTRIYSGWVEDERVGGILTRYMTPEQARSWIKDGPMKEYSRARRGAGRYAAFGRQAGTTASDVARVALGAGTRVVDGTEGVKPFHCRAVRGERTAYLAWGDARNFRNLLWAAVRAAVLDGVEAHVIVMESPQRPTPGDDVKLHKALGERCGLSVHHMRERLSPPAHQENR